MKYIAHRGACLECQENTVAALEKGAEYGAFAVECDPRYTKDKTLVLFHDEDLRRIAGNSSKVSEITCDEMRTILYSAGKEFSTLDGLIRQYRGNAAILLDLTFDATDENFYQQIKNAPLHFIVGTHTVAETEVASRYFDKKDILGFIPNADAAAAFTEAGAGMVRLWEQWLKESPIAAVRSTIPEDCEIWIMSYEKINHPLFCMNSSPEQLRRLASMGADGVLLNDIKMAVSLR